GRAGAPVDARLPESAACGAISGIERTPGALVGARLPVTLHRSACEGVRVRLPARIAGKAAFVRSVAIHARSQAISAGNRAFAPTPPASARLPAIARNRRDPGCGTLLGGGTPPARVLPCYGMKAGGMRPVEGRKRPCSV